jgi:predicted 2-oxoglutarate/Fe(II)-dependent dioxygenase YbiX/peroxiredoxin
MTLQVGDPAPLFEARTGGTPNFPFHTVAGRPIVLSFLGSLQNALAAQVLQGLLKRYRPWFDDRQACFFGVSTDPMDEQLGLLRDEMPGVRFIRDFDRKVSALFGAITPTTNGHSIYQAKTIVLDTMLRVVSVIPANDVGQHGAELDRVIARITTEPQDLAAPILMISNVFEKELCELLVSLHQTQGGRSSGFMEDLGNKTVETSDARYKKRRDVIVTDVELQARLRERVGRRLVPAILQCFQFHVTHLERYLIGCYDAAERGFFTAHRDNVTRGTAHRRLAVTVHLNEDYDGGELVFPEFGSSSYRGQTGSAVVFSCSLMHEVLPVQRGRRYAYLPFLHDDHAEKIRLQNHQYIVSNG